MKKTARYVLIALGVLAALLLGIIAFVAITIDPNAYRGRLANWAKQATGRELIISGPIQLRLFPSVTAAVGKMVLKEADGKQDFVVLEGGSFSARFLPLLRGQMIAGQIELRGLAVNLKRRADRSTNFADLFPKGDQPGGFSFDIAGIRLNEAMIRFDDEREGRHYQLKNLTVKTGRLADRTPSTLEVDFQISGDPPALAAQAALKGEVEFDLSTRRYQLRKMALALNGSLADIQLASLDVKGDLDLRLTEDRIAASNVRISARGARQRLPFDASFAAASLTFAQGALAATDLTGELRASPATGKIAAKFSAPSLAGEGGTLRAARFAMDLAATQSDLQLDARLAGPLGVDLGRKDIQLQNLSGTLTAQRGSMSLAGTLQAPLSLNWETGAFALSTLAFDTMLKGPDLAFTAKLDSPLEGNYLTNSFNAPQLSMDLNGTVAGGKASVRLAADAALDANGGLQMRRIAGDFQVSDAAQREYALAGKLDGALSGDWNRQRFSARGVALDVTGTLQGSPMTGKISTNLTADLAKQRVTSERVALTLQLRHPARTLRASLTSPLEAQLAERQFHLSKLAADLSVVHVREKNRVVNGSLNGAATLDLEKQQVWLTLAGKLDASKLAGKFGVFGFTHAAYSVDAEIDQLDWDRLSWVATTEAAMQPKKTSRETGPAFDLASLQALDINGTVRIGMLKSGGVSARKIKLELVSEASALSGAAKGRLQP